MEKVFEFEYKTNDLVITETGNRYRIVEDGDCECGFFLESEECGAYNTHTVIRRILKENHRVYRNTKYRPSVKSWAELIQKEHGIPNSFELVRNKRNVKELTVEQISELLGCDVKIIKG